MGHTYISKVVGLDGRIEWSDREDATWQKLLSRQEKMVEKYACKEFIEGLTSVGFEQERVPQHSDINRRLLSMTGWKVLPVVALISDEEFHRLLSEKTFPGACFMRIPEELDYLEEPDIFHEFFGHLPLLTWRPYADFLEKFGQIALKIDRHLRRQLFRIFWFTAEFGLIKTDKGMKVYGAGILSSYGEISRAIEATNLEKLPFDILTCARTDYRYDTMQSKYFFIESFDTLFSLFENDITPILEEALSLGDIDSTPSPVPLSP